MGIRNMALITVAAMLLLCGLAVNTSAYGTVYPDREAKLTLEYSEQQAGAAVTLHRVAVMDDRARYALTEGFIGSGIIIGDDMSASDWSTAAYSLGVYAASRVPYRSDVIPGGGTISFTGLETGLYLVMTESTMRYGTVYSSAAFLISLPGLTEGDVWSYDIKARPKHTAYTPPSGDVDITVIKLWNDTGYSAYRPTGVTAQLLRDGTLYDSIRLSASNHWRATWTGLSSEHDWTVREYPVPSGYSVSYAHTAEAHVITNTRRQSTPVPESTPIPLGTPDPGTNTNANTPIPLGTPRLWRTGVTRWPVPVMTASGAVLFAVGWYISSKGGKGGNG